METFKEGQIVYSTEEMQTQFNIEANVKYRVEKIQLDTTYFVKVGDPSITATVNNNYLSKLFTTTKPTTMNNRFPFKLSAGHAKTIINNACNQWREKLADQWAVNIILGNTSNVSEEFYKLMRRACTPAQHELFDEIFGKDEPEYKVGDVVIVKGYSQKYDGKPLTITRIYTGSIGLPYCNFTPCENESNNFSLSDIVRHATPQEIKEYEQSQKGIFTEKGIDALVRVIEMNITNLHIVDYANIPGENPREKAQAISKLIYDTWCK